jgi:hypothetical protein
MCSALTISFKKTIFYLLSLLIAFLIISGKFIDTGIGIRAFDVLNKLFLLDFESLLGDSSIRDRYCHIALPLEGFFRDYGMPHGISNFNQEVATVDFNSLCYLIYSNDNSKIMSGLGQMIYENGIFSFLAIFSIIHIVKNSLAVHYKKIFVSTALLLSQVSSGTLALPLFGVIVGVFLYKSEIINE